MPQTVLVAEQTAMVEEEPSELTGKAGRERKATKMTAMEREERKILMRQIGIKRRRMCEFFSSSFGKTGRDIDRNRQSEVRMLVGMMLLLQFVRPCGA